MHGMDIDVMGRIMTTLLTHGIPGAFVDARILQRSLCLWQSVKDQESRTKWFLRVKDQMPLAGGAVRDVLEWGKFF